MSGPNTEEQMVRANKERGERNLAYRLRLRQLGCKKEILEKVEVFNDLIIDYATEQNRVIQEGQLRLKEIMNQ